MKRRQTDITGHACEHLVCFDLAKRGMRVLSNPFEMSPYDIIAEHEGKLIKIQVKGTSKPTAKVNSEKRVSMTYRFNYDPVRMEHCDLVAFVSLDKETIIYKDPKLLTATGKSVCIPPMKMSDGEDKELLALLA